MRQGCDGQSLTKCAVRRLAKPIRKRPLSLFAMFFVDNGERTFLPQVINLLHLDPLVPLHVSLPVCSGRFSLASAAACIDLILVTT